MNFHKIEIKTLNIELIKKNTTTTLVLVEFVEGVECEMESKQLFHTNEIVIEMQF